MPNAIPLVTNWKRKHTVHFQRCANALTKLQGALQPPLMHLEMTSTCTYIQVHEVRRAHLNPFHKKNASMPMDSQRFLFCIVRKCWVDKIHQRLPLCYLSTSVHSAPSAFPKGIIPSLHELCKWALISICKSCQSWPQESQKREGGVGIDWKLPCEIPHLAADMLST